MNDVYNNRNYYHTVMRVGVLLFMIGCLPTYWASFRNYNDFVILKPEITLSKRYDDELVYNINTAIFDLYESRHMSIEQKTYYTKVHCLKRSLESRYKMYTTMLTMTRPGSPLNTYYNKRSDEFSGLLQKLNRILD